MECKLSLISIKMFMAKELIDTLWNVNVVANADLPKVESELIDTLWNVNINSTSSCNPSSSN